jgi:DNA replication protein DnaC
VGWLRRDLPVGHPEFGRLIPCQCRKDDLTARRRARLQNLSHLGALTRLTFDTLIADGRNPETPQHRDRFRRAVTAARSFAEDPRGWLVLAGPPGCGKTHLAAAIGNARLALEEPVFFEVVPDLLDHLRATFGPSSEVSYDDLFETVRGHPLLILDDLGTQSATPWAVEKLYQLFNTRYNERLPTVVTTNRPLEEFEERLRVRLTDPDLVHLCWLQPPQSAAFQRLGPMPALLLEMCFETFDPEGGGIDERQGRSLRKAFEQAQKFAARPNGWLVFRGPPGTGKSHLAAAIVNQRIASNELPTFIGVPDLLDHLRSTFAPESSVTYDELFETIRTAPLLVLDDLGTQSATAWAQEKLYQLLNYRYNARLATVVTTNLSLESLEPRLSSRLRDKALSVVCEIAAPDYRRRDPRGDRPRSARPEGP